MDFLYAYGAEMLVETARMWTDLGFYSQEKDGAFCIVRCNRAGTKYTTVVDNNLFTKPDGQGKTFSTRQK